MAVSAHQHESLMPLPALPEIPAKRYFAIGEVAELCGVRPHVLRYWEQEFPQLKPVKRRGNRRYYLREDVEVVRTIRRLLHEQGFTISGARQQLAQQAAQLPSRRAAKSNPATRATAVVAASRGPSRSAVALSAAPVSESDTASTPVSLVLSERHREIRSLVDDLEGFLDRLDLE